MCTKNKPAYTLENNHYYSEVVYSLFMKIFFPYGHFTIYFSRPLHSASWKITIIVSLMVIASPKYHNFEAVLKYKKGRIFHIEFGSNNDKLCAQRIYDYII